MNNNFFISLTNFLKKRTLELIGLVLIIVSVSLFISFITYSPNDPSFVYGEKNLATNNFLGKYGSFISDFLLQSFGLTSFLLILTFISWGVSLIFKKEIKLLIIKSLFIILYLILGSTFIYITYNNSFWLIDNGNSGFLGQIVFDFINTYLPLINHKFSGFFLFGLTVVFFSLASEINFKSFFKLILSPFFLIIKNKNNLEKNNALEEISTKEQSLVEEKPQQSFSFEKNVNSEHIDREKSNKLVFKLPSTDLLEKNENKINDVDLEKNRPNAEFMEKILLDFGIDGKIKKINNGPVVSLYEFEPAAS